jgi:hypothetical protein
LVVGSRIDRNQYHLGSLQKGAIPMQTSRIMAAVVVLLSFAALTTLAQDQDQYIKVEIKGTLKTGIVAIGGETTGTTITVKGKDILDVTWELDLGGNQEFIALAKKLDGKTALVAGTYSKKKGVEVRERQIVKVTSLKEPPAK